MTIIFGTRRSDAIEGTDAGEIILAGRGNDTVDAGGGDDLVLGGRGRDVLDGGAGSDWVDGGSGRDVLIYDATRNEGACDVYLGGRGCDTLVLRLTGEQLADADVRAEIDAFLCTSPRSAFHFDTLDLWVHSLERLVVEEIEGEAGPAPAPTDDALAVTENGSVTLDLLANDAGESLAIVAIDAASVTGTLVDLGDGSVAYAPVGRDALAAGETATETFTYTVRDAEGREATATATVTITGTNDAPTLDGAVTLDAIDEDASLTFSADDLLAGASDVDARDADANDALSVTGLAVVPGSLDGTLTDNGDGTWTFAPAPDASGTLALTYGVTDGTQTVAQTATLDVVAVNDAPEAGVEIPEARSDEDAAISIALPEGAFTDDDGDTLDLTATLADGSALPAWLSFDGERLTGQPPANFNGALALTVTASDGTAAASQSFTLAIDPVNDAPMLVTALANVSSPEDAAIDVAIPDGTFTDGTFTDVDGDTLTLTATLADGSALPAWLSFDGERLTGTPPADFDGSLDLRVTATDPSGASASDAFTLDIAPRNDAPTVVAQPGGVFVLEEQAFEFSLSGPIFADADGDDLTFTAELADGSPLPAWIEYDGSLFTGRPPEDFNGSLQIALVATDPSGASARASFRFDVDPVNDAPTVSGAVALDAIAEDASVTITAAALLAGASDVDDATPAVANLAVAPGSLDGTLVDLGDGTWTFTPAPDATGTLALSYDVTDGALSVAQTATLEVTPVNDAPDIFIEKGGTFADLPPSTPGGETRTRYTIDLGATDVDGDDLTFSFSRLPGFDETPQEASELTYSIDGDGVVTLVYSDDLNGEVTFEVEVSDGNGGTDTISRSVFRFDVIDGTAGDDVLTGTDRWEEINGGAGDDVITGGEGENFLYGGAGNDTITGGGNNDDLFGGAGDDTIVGGGFGDDLHGEDGSDVLTGGDGNDDFHFDLTAGHAGTDRITDFTSGGDDLWITGGGDAAAILATETADPNGFRYDLGDGQSVIVNVQLGTDDFVFV